MIEENEYDPPITYPTKLHKGRYCPVCAEEAVSPLGSTDNDYLIIEEFPYAMLTPKRTSFNRNEIFPQSILQLELDKVGMLLGKFRFVSVFPHFSHENGDPNANCYASGLARAVDEINGKKGVIILGANLCKEFTGYELKKVCGLSYVDTKYMPDGDVPRVFLPSIDTIYSTGAGEFGLGLMRFAKQIGVI